MAGLCGWSGCFSVQAAISRAMLPVIIKKLERGMASVCCMPIRLNKMEVTIAPPPRPDALVNVTPKAINTTAKYSFASRGNSGFLSHIPWEQISARVLQSLLEVHRESTLWLAKTAQLYMRLTSHHSPVLRIIHAAF